jgi:hypothetical protein
LFCRFSKSILSGGKAYGTGNRHKSRYKKHGHILPLHVNVLSFRVVYADINGASGLTRVLVF